MQHRYAFECLDRSLRDIMKSVDPNRYQMPFGGITVLLGGDFRQILPVINYASRGDIVSACITNSLLWYNAKIYILHRNMRLNQGNTAEEVEELRTFAEWVLKIGNGTLKPPQQSHITYEEDDILLPINFCDPDVQNSVENMIEWTYPDLLSNYMSASYISERAILTPTNQVVGHLNSQIVENLPGEQSTYFSVDRAEDFGGTASDLGFAFPPEYLNAFNISGLPAHDLKLKVGAAVMLMRNLNQTLGLCNGTRMIVTKCLRNCVECEHLPYFWAFVFIHTFRSTHNIFYISFHKYQTKSQHYQAILFQLQEITHLMFPWSGLSNSCFYYGQMFLYCRCHWEIRAICSVNLCFKGGQQKNQCQIQNL
ncbi:hypothetical protein DCAR_0417680 [Daucus carota subsp. sativus]|uniref:ATP-dependent DNA helicase n=1 Tax=Daucus carota subsp. sativus TaxID=79200 RepID=A0AAF1AXG9_DAUCS|nr:hypothetical protein DCAR_0417680 [Daucus carota subsp. sativus]